MDFRVGIDLGTTSSCVAVWKGSGVEIILDELGNRTIPSCVSFTDQGVLVGHAAMARVHVDPANTIFDVLRLVGKKRGDILHYIQKLPFDVTENDRGRLKINVSYGGNRQSFFPEEIIALLLSKLKRMAESQLGVLVKEAVISYPYSFDLLQIQLLRTAASVAGLEARFSSSSALAALAFGFNKQLHQQEEGEEQSIVVFNMGAGNVEASLLVVDSEVYDVRGLAGSSECGGQDITDTLVSHFLQEFKKLNISCPTDSKTLLKLRTECERVKKVLSTTLNANFQLESVINESSDSITITRTMFDEICEDLFLSVMEVINESLVDCSSMMEQSIDHIVLVGGSTRIPKLQNLIEDKFRKVLNRSVNPDEAIAVGAALRAVNMRHENSTPALGLPPNFILLEVVPHSLGIEIEDKKVEHIISKGTHFPKDGSTVFVHTFGEAISIKVYEGENLDTRGNRLIGELISESCYAEDVVITLSFTYCHTLPIEVKDLNSFALLMSENDVSLKLHTLEEIEFMKGRNSQFGEQLNRRTQYMEARNKLECYTFTLKSEVRSGKLMGDAAQAVLTACQSVLQDLESTEYGTADRINILHLQLQHTYEQQLTVAGTMDSEPIHPIDKVNDSLSV